MKIRQYLVLVVLQLGVGCANIPQESEIQAQAKQYLPKVPMQWQAIEARVRSEKLGWLDAYGDSTLKAFVYEAIANNPELALVRMQIRRAEEIAVLAGADRRPFVSVSGRAEGLGQVDKNAITQNRLIAQFSWEVDLWGRLKVRQNAAEQALQAVEADYRGARNLLAAATVQIYLLCVEFAQQEVINQRLVESLRGVVKIVESRMENGIVDAGDVALARADLASAEVQLLEIGVARRNVLRSLEVLMGRYPAAMAQYTSTFPSFPGDAVISIPSNVLESRPDIVAAERRVAAAMGGFEFARTARLPGLSINAEIGEASLQLGGLVPANELAWQGLVDLVTPLFTGGRIAAQQRLAKIGVSEAVWDYTRTALSAFSEIESLLDQSETLSKQVKTAQAAYTESKRALDVAVSGYELGEGELLDVLILQQRVFVNEAQLLALKRARLEQYAVLNAAIGLPPNGEVSAI